MPAIIDSAPDCVSSDPGTQEARVADSGDFVLGDPYQDCAGFMTFGPGSTYGPEGVGAETPTWSSPGSGSWSWSSCWSAGSSTRIAAWSDTLPPAFAPVVRRRRQPLRHRRRSCMNGKQIEFPPKQTHVKSFERAMLIISILCVMIVLIVVFGTNIGDEFRPTV